MLLGSVSWSKSLGAIRSEDLSRKVSKLEKKADRFEVLVHYVEFRLVD